MMTRPTRVRLGGYATLDLRSEYRLNDEWRLQGRDRQPVRCRLRNRVWLQPAWPGGLPQRALPGPVEAGYFE